MIKSHPPGSSCFQRYWHHNAGFFPQATPVHRSMRMKDDNATRVKGMWQKFLYNWNWCFPQRLGKKTSLFTFFARVDICKNVTSRQALTIPCWLTQSLKKTHYRFRQKTCSAQLVLMYTTEVLTISTLSQKREAVKCLGELEALLQDDVTVPPQTPGIS